MEQARCARIRSTPQLITNAGDVDVSFDDIPAVNVDGAAQRFEPESYIASTIWDSSPTVMRIPSGTDYNGTYIFNAEINIDSGAATFFDVRIQRTSGGTTTFARSRVAAAPTTTVVSLSGMYDCASSNQIRLEITHDDPVVGGLTLNSARMSCMLIGGPVTVP